MDQTQFASTARALLADAVSEAATYVWPLSFKSAPSWGAFVAVVITSWAVSHFLAPTPDSIKRSNEKKRIRYNEFMEALMGWHRSKVEDPDCKDKDDVLPEASRILDLLYDDVGECRTIKYGALPLNTEMEALFRRSCEKELREAMRKTRKARDFLNLKTASSAVKLTDLGATEGRTDGKDDAGSAEGKDYSLKDLAEFESGEKLVGVINFAGNPPSSV